MPLPTPGLRIDRWELLICRAEIEAEDVVSALSELLPLLRSENTHRFRRKVALAIDGYADDSRDLFEIPEVRLWLINLDRHFPFWFFFLHLESQSTLGWLTFALCDYAKVPNGKSLIAEDHRRFMYEHFVPFAALCRSNGYTAAEEREMAREIDAFYF